MIPFDALNASLVILQGLSYTTIISIYGGVVADQPVHFLDKLTNNHNKGAYIRIHGYARYMW